MSAPAKKPVALRNDGLVLVTEPVEGAFTLLMPEGWTNMAQLQREHSLNRIIASAIKPDQTTMVHLGDPRIPIFMEPNAMMDPSLMQFSPHLRLQPYTPAPHFFCDYVQQCFGNAPGFRLGDISESPNLLRLALADQRRAGRQARVATAAITFQHVYNGRPMHCRLHGITTGIQLMWTADHVTISSTANLDENCVLGLRMMMSRHFNPNWVAAQQQLHEQRMALGRQQIDFTNNMTRMQAQGHQQRMQDIQNFGQTNTRMHEERMAQMDTSLESWRAGQEQADVQQRSWIDHQVQDDAMQQARVNAIREEHTVVDAGGTTYQVDIHHERYFVNKRDNTYIGAGATTEQQDLRRTHGVNPDDYEEVRVVR